MDITITGRHIEVTDAIRQTTIEKFERLHKHYGKMILNIDVKIGVEKAVQWAEATVHIPNSDVFARAESDNLYNSIDALTDKLKRQLAKHHDK